MNILIFILFSGLAIHCEFKRYLDDFSPARLIAVDCMVWLAFFFSVSFLADYLRFNMHGDFCLISFSIALVLSWVSHLNSKYYWSEVQRENNLKIKLSPSL
jgi:hypothetical protein